MYFILLLVEYYHSLLGVDQGRVLPPRRQDSEAVRQWIGEKLAFLRTHLIPTFSFTEFQWEQKIVMRQLRSLTIFDPG